jgi:hypothetical protein
VAVAAAVAVVVELLPMLLPMLLWTLLACRPDARVAPTASCSHSRP